MRKVALLGSINVGGNRLRMADLRAALENAGFANVATVTASGNVLFDDDGSGDVEARIEALLADEFSIRSFAAVRTKAELASAITDNPFAKDGEERFVHTIFLEEDLDRAKFEAFAKGYEGPERLAAGSREFYVDYAEGVGRSRLDPAMRKAKPIAGRATARNIRSLKRILDMMGD